jgi:uncharacterized protein (DUF1697 family)
MPRYVAFLRGINVGGHNIIHRAKLQEIFISLGYQNVSVYKQSGNIIFDADTTNEELIKKTIQEKLSAILNRETGIFLRSISYLEEILKNKPFKNADANNASLWVTFLASKPPKSTLPLKIPQSKAEIILIKKTEAYSVTHGGGEGGQPNPFLEKKFKIQATTRNLNIIKQIVENYSK